MSDAADALRSLRAISDAQLAFAQQAGAVTSHEAVARLAELLRGQLGDR